MQQEPEALDRPDEAYLGFLTSLEISEAELLSWGLVDAGFTEAEIEERAFDFLSERGLLGQHSATEFLQELRALGFIVRLDSSGGSIFRSRMAETVRLLSRMKQLFAKHVDGGGWRIAPNLVADYRLIIRPRRYARRDRPSRVVVRELESEGLLTREGALTARALLTSETGDEFSLSGFQVRATNRVLRNTESRRSSGVIITAGTGTGKTLAFYLPTLTHIAANRLSEHAWVKALAVYPRNELLKDQLSETFAQARRLDVTLARSGKRKLKVGAFYGDTPGHAGWVTRFGAWGSRVGDGYVCPFLRCPTCGSDVAWPHVDASADRERLVCVNPTCGSVLSDDEIVLTRERFYAEPPDIVFTTTEMMNQRFTDTEARHVFGLGPRAPQKPEIMLLDEVHTYRGTHGAQVAMLLRRWRSAIGRKVQFVGLSATLEDAESFFAQLTGVHPAAVSRVGPQPDEMMSEGMEYLIALRGDPASSAGLLSTTIQTAMLLRRTLDAQTRPSLQTYGHRLFVFTDDLDVTNRLFYDLRDAEGYDRFGKPATQKERPYGSLANLRSPLRPEHLQRLASGQSWDIAEQIGHSLDRDQRMVISRTSSQDTGVKSDSDIIVATASLEVGYNDPDVGGIVQHKAPRDAAQFLQRMGRAGRIRHMRPWVAVVLSDYGRDRITYQAYDILFDPELRPRHLPLGNRYVLRMQAVYAMMDWLGQQVSSPDGSIWQDLAQPWERARTETKQKNQRVRQSRILKHVDSLLTSSETQAKLSVHLESALGIDREEVSNLMWEPPRGLVTAVLPTMRRRLTTNWELAFPTETAHLDYNASNSPLPDFVPHALFSDLALPEVTVSARQRSGDDAEERHLPIAQAIKEFMPGRVTKRYAIEHGYVRHWIDPGFGPETDEADLDNVTVEVESFCSHSETLGSVRDNGTDVEVVRPWRIEPVSPPASIADSSNSFPEWGTLLVPFDEGIGVDIPHPGPWAALLSDIRFRTHNRGSGVAITRFARGGTASIRNKKGDGVEAKFTFARQGKAASLGFTLDVDAIQLLFDYPDLALGTFPSDVQRSLRSAYFEHLNEVNPLLDRLAGRFKIEWLGRLFLSVLVSRALEDRSTLRDAHSSIASEELVNLLTDALDGTLQNLIQDAWSPELADSGADQDSAAERGRLGNDLLTLIQTPGVMSEISGNAPVLWASQSEDWLPWIRDRFRSTVGSVFVDAAQRIDPEIDPSDLVVDLLPPGVGQSLERGEVWISESTMGGAGVVESILGGYSSDPRRFFSLMESALEASDFELVDTELRRVLQLVEDDAAVNGALQRLRHRQGVGDSVEALKSLLQTLSDRGIFACHPVVSALNARVLRPGSSNSTDLLLLDLTRRWVAAEESFGIDIDPSAIAYASSHDDALDTAISAAYVPPTGERSTWRIGTILSLLWPRGWRVRALALHSYNPFGGLPDPDRKLLTSTLDLLPNSISVTTDGWVDQLRVELVGRGDAVLTSPSDASELLAQAVSSIVSTPIEFRFIHLYPRVTGVSREDGSIGVRVQLRDVHQ